MSSPPSTPAHVPASTDAAEEWVVAARKYIEEHWREAPRLTAVADAAGCSPFHLHRLFRKAYGITIKACITDLQITGAKRQLADTNDKLAEIAKACGFAHDSHFCSAFKQAVGVPPGEWRRQQREAKTLDQTGKPE